jgi:NADH-quinone oxidoreductase subunit H
VNFRRRPRNELFPGPSFRLGDGHDLAFLIATVVCICHLLPVMLSVAMVIYVDRKVWASMALRRGPNVVGPFGLLQSFADGLKVFLQETIIPTAANKGLFLIAPIITFTVALLAWAVIPFNSGAILANINVGLLYISRFPRWAFTASSSPVGRRTRSIRSFGDARLGPDDQL